MREVLIPAQVTVGATTYKIMLQMYNDEVINRDDEYHVYRVNFEERSEGRVLIPDAINWVKNTVGVNPFVIPQKMYYIGSDTPNARLKDILEGFNIEYTKIGETGDTQPTRMTLNNGDSIITHNINPSVLSTDNARFYTYANFNNTYANSGTLETQSWIFETFIKLFPTNAIRGNAIQNSSGTFCTLQVRCEGVIASLKPYVQRITIQITPFDGDLWQQDTSYGDLIDLTYQELNADINGFSGENPYEINPSTFGGGYGTGIINPSDLIPDPEAPDIDAISTGLLTVFKPTLTQIQTLGDYLWSNAFDVDTLKKLFGDPMDAIIGLSIVPVNPPGAGSKNVKVGNIDTGISMAYLTRQFVEKNLGSLTIDPYIGSFMDYSPYTKIQIYLPYVGFRELSPGDVMGTTISIKYIIDVITGGCVASLNVSGKGAIYQFNGSCIANVPLTALNYSGAIQNAISAVGSIATTGAGIATGNPAMAGVGAIGLATRASNAVINSHPTIQRSGNCGGASGLCGVQFPYAVIERPRLSTPANYNGFIGNTLNVTLTLGECDGLTMIEEIHLDNVLCTENERDELMKMLKEGVIIHVPEPEPEPTPNT